MTWIHIVISSQATDFYVKEESRNISRNTTERHRRIVWSWSSNRLWYYTNMLINDWTKKSWEKTNWLPGTYSIQIYWWDVSLGDSSTTPRVADNHNICQITNSCVYLANVRLLRRVHNIFDDTEIDNSITSHFYLMGVAFNSEANCSPTPIHMNQIIFYAYAFNRFLLIRDKVRASFTVAASRCRADLVYRSYLYGRDGDA